MTIALNAVAASWLRDAVHCGILRRASWGIMMSKETISFRIPAAKRTAVDELAAALDRDRSAIINEAIDAYLELHHWQVEHIKRALSEAESGMEGMPHDEVFARLRGRIDERLKSSS